MKEKVKVSDRLTIIAETNEKSTERERHQSISFFHAIERYIDRMKNGFFTM
jgi:hypothetical protein